MSDNTKTLITTVALCLMWTAASAEVLSLRQVTDMAMTNNPGIRMGLSEIQRAEIHLSNAGRLESPTIELGHSSDRAGNDVGEESFEIAYAQQFPVTSRLKNEKKLSRLQLEMARAELNEARRQLAYEVEKTVVELSVATLEAQALQKHLSLNNKSVVFLEKQVDRGESSPLDHVQARITSRQLDTEIKSVEQKADRLREELARLTGNDKPVRVNHPLDLPSRKQVTPSITMQARERRPDYILARLKEREADITAAIAEGSRWADIEIALFVERESTIDEPTGLEDNTIAGARLSWPLPFNGHYKRARALAEADQQASAINSVALKREIASEYREAERSLDSAFKTAISVSKEIIPLAEENHKKIREAYQLGQVGLLEVRAGQAQLLEVRRSELKHVAVYHQSHARYRYVTGSYSFLGKQEGTTREK